MPVSAANPAECPDERSTREMLSGNLCRSTGYQKHGARVSAYRGAGRR
jgi:aerobic-type carbon monoxide dehydrogenase small subunit (CoxS/CutS family)